MKESSIKYILGCISMDEPINILLLDVEERKALYEYVEKYPLTPQTDKG